MISPNIVVTMINFGARGNPLLRKFSFERAKAVNRIGNQIRVNSIALSANQLFNFCPLLVYSQFLIGCQDKETLLIDIICSEPE